MNIKVEYEDLENLGIRIKTKSSKYDSQLNTLIKKTVLSIEREAKKNLTSNGSVKSGHLRRMVGTKIGNTQGEVHTSNVKYAIYVEKGTKAHIIRPKRKKFLYWQGASHPVKKVNHPGTKAKPFLIPAFKKEVPKFLEDLKEITDITLD